MCYGYHLRTCFAIDLQRSSGRIADQIRLAAEALPSRYRDVVEMVFFKGMTFQNAAHFLNLASATVSRRVSKAIELMSASLLNDRLDVSCERLMRLVEHCESI